MWNLVFAGIFTKLVVLASQAKTTTNCQYFFFFPKRKQEAVFGLLGRIQQKLLFWQNSSFCNFFKFLFGFVFEKDIKPAILTITGYAMVVFLILFRILYTKKRKKSKE
jgi:hypothetical protein